MTLTALALEIPPLLVFMAVVLLGLLFFAFLLVRRTMVGFREGVEKGRE